MAASDAQASGVLRVLRQYAVPLQRIFKQYAAAEPAEGDRAPSWKEVVASANTMSQTEFLKLLADYNLLSDLVSRLQAVEIFCVSATTWVKSWPDPLLSFEGFICALQRLVQAVFCGKEWDVTYPTGEDKARLLLFSMDRTNRLFKGNAQALRQRRVPHTPPQSFRQARALVQSVAEYPFGTTPAEVGKRQQDARNSGSIVGVAGYAHPQQHQPHGRQAQQSQQSQQRAAHLPLSRPPPSLSPPRRQLPAARKASKNSKRRCRQQRRSRTERRKPRHATLPAAVPGPHMRPSSRVPATAPATTHERQTLAQGASVPASSWALAMSQSLSRAALRTPNTEVEQPTTAYSDSTSADTHAEVVEDDDFSQLDALGDAVAAAAAASVVPEGAGSAAPPPKAPPVDLSMSTMQRALTSVADGRTGGASSRRRRHADGADLMQVQTEDAVQSAAQAASDALAMRAASRAASLLDMPAVVEVLARLFDRYCRFGDRLNSATTGGLSSSKFYKFARDCGMLDDGFRHPDVDIVYKAAASKATKNTWKEHSFGIREASHSMVNRRLAFPEFLRALSMVAVRKFPRAQHASRLDATPQERAAAAAFGLRLLLARHVLPFAATLQGFPPVDDLLVQPPADSSNADDGDEAWQRQEAQPGGHAGDGAGSSEAGAGVGADGSERAGVAAGHDGSTAAGRVVGGADGDGDSTTGTEQVLMSPYRRRGLALPSTGLHGSALQHVLPLPGTDSDSDNDGGSEPGSVPGAHTDARSGATHDGDDERESSGHEEAAAGGTSGADQPVGDEVAAPHWGRVLTDAASAAALSHGVDTGVPQGIADVRQQIEDHLASVLRLNASIRERASQLSDSRSYAADAPQPLPPLAHLLHRSSGPTRSSATPQAPASGSLPAHAPASGSLPAQAPASGSLPAQAPASASVPAPAPTSAATPPPTRRQRQSIIRTPQPHQERPPQPVPRSTPRVVATTTAPEASEAGAPTPVRRPHQAAGQGGGVAPRRHRLANVWTAAASPGQGTGDAGMSELDGAGATGAAADGRHQEGEDANAGRQDGREGEESAQHAQHGRVGDDAAGGSPDRQGDEAAHDSGDAAVVVGAVVAPSPTPRRRTVSHDIQPSREQVPASTPAPTFAAAALPSSAAMYTPGTREFMAAFFSPTDAVQSPLSPALRLGHPSALRTRLSAPLSTVAPRIVGRFPPEEEVAGPTGAVATATATGHGAAGGSASTGPVGDAAPAATQRSASPSPATSSMALWRGTLSGDGVELSPQPAGVGGGKHVASSGSPYHPSPQPHVASAASGNRSPVPSPTSSTPRMKPLQPPVVGANGGATSPSTAAMLRGDVNDNVDVAQALTIAEKLARVQAMLAANPGGAAAPSVLAALIDAQSQALALAHAHASRAAQHAESPHHEQQPSPKRRADSPPRREQRAPQGRETQRHVSPSRQAGVARHVPAADGTSSPPRASGHAHHLSGHARTAVRAPLCGYTSFRPLSPTRDGKKLGMAASHRLGVQSRRGRSPTRSRGASRRSAPRPKSTAPHMPNRHEVDPADRASPAPPRQAPRRGRSRGRARTPRRHSRGADARRGSQRSASSPPVPSPPADSHARDRPHRRAPSPSPARPCQSRPGVQPPLPPPSARPERHRSHPPPASVPASSAAWTPASARMRAVTPAPSVFAVSRTPSARPSAVAPRRLVRQHRTSSGPSALPLPSTPLPTTAMAPRHTPSTAAVPTAPQPSTTAPTVTPPSAASAPITRQSPAAAAPITRQSPAAAAPITRQSPAAAAPITQRPAAAAAPITRQVPSAAAPTSSRPSATAAPTARRVRHGRPTRPPARSSIRGRTSPPRTPSGLRRNGQDVTTLGDRPPAPKSPAHFWARHGVTPRFPAPPSMHVLRFHPAMAPARAGVGSSRRPAPTPLPAVQHGSHDSDFAAPPSLGGSSVAAHPDDDPRVSTLRRGPAVSHMAAFSGSGTVTTLSSAGGAVDAARRAHAIAARVAGRGADGRVAAPTASAGPAGAASDSNGGKEERAVLEGLPEAYSEAVEPGQGSAKLQFQLVFEKTVLSVEHHGFDEPPAPHSYASPQPPSRIPLSIQLLAVVGERQQLLDLHVLLTSAEKPHVHFRSTVNFATFEALQGTQPALAVLGFDDFPPKLAAMFEAAVAAPHTFQLCVIEEDAVKATLMLFERRQRGEPREMLRLSLRRSEAEVIKAYESELARQRYEQEQRGIGGL